MGLLFPKKSDLGLHRNLDISAQILKVNTVLAEFCFSPAKHRNLYNEKILLTLNLKNLFTVLENSK